jgi:hypothetical protein
MSCRPGCGNSHVLGATGIGRAVVYDDVMQWERRLRAGFMLLDRAGRLFIASRGVIAQICLSCHKSHSWCISHAQDPRARLPISHSRTAK